MHRTPCLLLSAISVCLACRQRMAAGEPHAPTPVSAIAFASFAPLNADIFVANADGSDPQPLQPHPALDYNASFSPDGQWVVFTSERNGSADLYRVRPDGMGLERLTDDPAFDDQGVLSPDGRLLAFVSSRGGQADIWILDLARRALRQVTNDSGGDFRPAWSPDGQWIAFSSDRDSQRPHAGFVTLHSTALYVVRPDGSGLRRLTGGAASVGSPAWSLDGTQLAVYEADLDEVRKIGSARRMRGTTQIATVDFATGRRRVLTTGAGEKWSPRWLPGHRIGFVSGGPDGGVEFVNGPAGARGEARNPGWSPDGRRMVFHRDVDSAWPPYLPWYSRDPRYRLIRTGIFASYSPTGDRLVFNDGAAGILHNRILKMSADGSQAAVLFAEAERSALAPAWAPRSERIAFALGKFFPAVLGPSSAAIALVNSDGRGLRLLTDSTDNAGFPSWSPDERHIVYRRSSNGRNALMIVDLATGTARRLTLELGNVNSPAWSPRGDRIAFTARRDVDEDYDIYTVRPDGTDLRRLTDWLGNDSHPAWSPDGEWIAFTSARAGFKDEAALHPFNPQSYGDLHVMRADGSELRVLTDNQFEEGTPTWIPTARREGPTTGRR